MKFTPHIIIWELNIEYAEGINQTLYFLTRRGAKRFCKKNEDGLKYCKVTLGGETLWFW